MDYMYRAEYAKSARATCRGCISKIEKDSLRLAIMVQSPMFDGKVPNWYHFRCFFLMRRPRSVDDISHFESLRWSDQEAIRSKIEAQPVTVNCRKRDSEVLNNETLKDFRLEYSKSNRATCKTCGKNFLQNEVKVCKKDFKFNVDGKCGKRKQDMWHHVTCFANVRTKLQFYESADKLSGFANLKVFDQHELMNLLPAVNSDQEVTPLKQSKPSTALVTTNTKDKAIQDQNKLLFSYYDELKVLKKNELQLLLETNDQRIPPGRDRMLDRLADIMTFGALKPCSKCRGQYVFHNLGYICQGYLTEWSRCNNITKNPKRFPFLVPAELANKYPFLESYTYVPRTRIIRDSNPMSAPLLEKENVDSFMSNYESHQSPLHQMEFVISRTIGTNIEVIQLKIMREGGKIVTTVGHTVMAVISSVEDILKMGVDIVEAKAKDIHVVSEDFCNEVEQYAGRIPELVIKKSISSWGSDPYIRLPPTSSSLCEIDGTLLESRFNKSFMSMPSGLHGLGRLSGKSGCGKVTMKLKNGGAVDPDSGLANCAHIYQSNGVKYTATLGLTDIQRQLNKYYKLQLLETDKGKDYFLFRSWGRIGTTIGAYKVEGLPLQKAIDQFCTLYEEKSGNPWENRYCFVKVPGRMYPIDIDYEDDTLSLQQINTKDVPSDLSKPVQDLIKLIFDVKMMKNVLLEFELDVEKMPLGKLSKAQLRNAYGVLNEMQNLVARGSPLNALIDASNRFYTYVPHSCGLNILPVIRDLDTIKKKIEMVDSLMEIELAYNVMLSAKSNGKNIIDANYEQLKTDIDVLDRQSEEFKIVEEYLQNSHGYTHNHFKLEIADVFMIRRQGEKERYKPFSTLHNRKLLWHGSRITNYVGILSQGLRIAPPEAPVSGYMFGKGIYFADMVSKSANYCSSNGRNKTGLLLLCEVALGEMKELYHAAYMEKPPQGKHSVKGLGRQVPDPNYFKIIPDDVHVPLGKPVQLSQDSGSLIYNEYIVYDVAQVNIKYLVKVNFNRHY